MSAVISLAERRAARRPPGPAPPRRGAHLRLVVPGEPAHELRLEIFMRRARAIMDAEDGGGTLVAFPDRIA